MSDLSKLLHEVKLSGSFDLSKIDWAWATKELAQVISTVSTAEQTIYPTIESAFPRVVQIWNALFNPKASTAADFALVHAAVAEDQTEAQKLIDQGPVEP